MDGMGTSQCHCFLVCWNRLSHMFCRQNVISHMFPDMFQLLYFFGGIRMLIGLNLSEMFLLQVKKTASSRSNVLESHHSLVGGLEHLLFFHIFARIIPTDFHIFQRGGSTTNQFLFFHKALSVDHEDHQEITRRSPFSNAQTAHCHAGWWFWTWLDYVPFHIWDVIRQPLTSCPSFFKMVCLHHQPVPRYSHRYSHIYPHISIDISIYIYIYIPI